MNVLKRRWKLVSVVALAVFAAARSPRAATARTQRDPDQGRRAVRLPGRVRLVRQPRPGRSGDRGDPVRRREAEEPEQPACRLGRGSINGHPLVLVGIGCSNDRADTAIKETKRLMEQLKADIMIGPLSGDESIAVANYAKQHPKKTFVDGAAGAQDTTLKVRAPNFFRFNGDGAQWNAGLGDLAYNKLGWRNAAVAADDYSFAWTSAAGFIAEFCAVGGKVTKRVFPPLNTTDYSSYAQQIPTNVDGTFVAVGGAGLIPFLKAYEQAHGPINSKKFIGNLFWGTPGQFEQLSTRVSGAYFGGAGTAGDLATRAAKGYNAQVGKTFDTIPPFGAAAPQASSTFTYGYYINTRGLISGLKKVKGNISDGQKSLQQAIGKVKIASPYGPLHLDKNRQAVLNVFYAAALHEGRQARDEDGWRDSGRRPDVRRHLLREDAGSGPQLPALREAKPPVGREDDSPAGHRLRAVDGSRSSRTRRADPPLAGDRPALRRPPCRTRRRSRRPVRREARDPRPERRRQDDALQRHLGRRRRRAPARSSSWARTSRALPPRARAKLGMGRTYQQSRSFLGLTVEDNLYLAVLGMRSGHLRPVVLPPRDGELRDRASELARGVGLGAAGRRSSGRSRTASSVSSRSAMARARIRA